jgi:putative transposase
MALRWTGAAMLGAAKRFRRLKARKQLPILQSAPATYQAKHASTPLLEQQAKAA